MSRQPADHGRKATAVIAIAIICAVSCQTDSRRRYRADLLNTGKPALHAVRSARLQTLMDDMNRQVFNRLPQELDEDQNRQQQTAEIADIAGELAGDAKHIPDVLKEVRVLTEEEQRLFISLSDKLGEQALQLQRHARNNRSELVRETMDNIIVTCNACHTAFRVLPAACDPHESKSRATAQSAHEI